MLRVSQLHGFNVRRSPAPVQSYTYLGNEGVFSGADATHASSTIIDGDLCIMVEHAGNNFGGAPTNVNATGFNQISGMNQTSGNWRAKVSWRDCLESDRGTTITGITGTNSVRKRLFYFRPTLLIGSWSTVGTAATDMGTGDLGAVSGTYGSGSDPIIVFFTVMRNGALTYSDTPTRDNGLSGSQVQGGWYFRDTSISPSIDPDAGGTNMTYVGLCAFRRAAE